MDALALLRLQMEWGAEDALLDVPWDRLQPAAAGVPLAGSAPRPPPHPTAPPAAITPANNSPATTPAAGAADAAAAAAAAQTLDALRAALAGFQGCALSTTASHLVFAAGRAEGGLLFVGEAPSAAEDRSGLAFDGPAGAYLDRMLASIGLDRGTALSTPLLPWRPPGGRPPTPAEIAICLPFLHRLIVLAAPRRLVLLGPLAARALLGAAPRRRTPAWLPAAVPGRSAPVPALPIPAPEAAMTKPAARRDAWAALRLLRRTIDEDSSQGHAQSSA